MPDDAGGLRAALGEAHRRYTRQVNFREGWRGYLWQGRFTSAAMDEPYLLAAARYVELNPDAYILHESNTPPCLPSHLDRLQHCSRYGRPHMRTLLIFTLAYP